MLSNQELNLQETSLQQMIFITRCAVEFSELEEGYQPDITCTVKAFDVSTCNF